jgi:hypothetical protein
LNGRPLGYEPNELPGCSTPHSALLHLGDMPTTVRILLGKPRKSITAKASHQSSEEARTNQCIERSISNGSCCSTTRMERETGFEPATTCLEGRGSTAELFPPRQWWAGRDSNPRRHRQQIYSLPPLTARPPTHAGADDPN